MTAQILDENIEITLGEAVGKSRLERADLKGLLGITQTADSDVLILDEQGPQNG